MDRLGPSRSWLVREMLWQTTAISTLDNVPAKTEWPIRFAVHSFVKECIHLSLDDITVAMVGGIYE